MMKKWICIAMSLVLFLGSVLPAAAVAASAESTGAAEAAAEQLETETETEAAAKARSWETDIRISIRDERQLMREAGMTLDAWDEAVARSRQKALADPLTKEKLLETDPDTTILEEDGQIRYIGGSGAFERVDGAAGAYWLVYRLVRLLGGREDTDLRLWSRLGISGQTVYSFHEVADSETVEGSSVKIALNERNEVTAVFANLRGESEEENETGDEEETGEEKEEALPPVSRQEAENAVLAHCEADGGTAPALYPEYTERTVHSQVDIGRATDLERDDSEYIPKWMSWVVYTDNEGEDREEYPYLAHYVKLDGTWRSCLPVREPGDEESRSGYRKQDVFKGMTAGEYTGEIRGINGKTRTVTVPVMYREEDKRWYLGDVGRRIAVADFYEAAYTDGHPLNLVGSGSNSGWDNEDLYMYYNYIRAWDFYADMGWIGPDGQGTDVVILKGLSYRDHSPYINACSFEKVENFQMFGYAPFNTLGRPLGLVQGLDVMAHEYTHTYTSSVMNENLYENDLGAINEAMSDIMGNLVEYICNDTEDEKWLLGENAGTVIRCMSDPNKKSQPSYVWDIYYGPHTDTPTLANDRGGVHSNSSLLNRIAALLCLRYGMSYEDAVAFWMTVAMGMTPGTDYRQMRPLLEWAAAASGNEDYLEALDTMITEERLEETGLPETLPAGLKLVRLRLPETEAFEDDNWTLLVYQVNARSIVWFGAELMKMILQTGSNPDSAALWKESLQEIRSHIRMVENRIVVDDERSENAFAEAVLHLLRGDGLLKTYTSWEEDDTREIPLVTEDIQTTLYMLMNISAGGSQINGAAVMIDGRWYDLNTVTPEEMQQAIAGISLRNLVGRNRSASGTEKMKVEFLPSDGLENIRLSAGGIVDLQ